MRRIAVIVTLVLIAASCSRGGSDSSSTSVAVATTTTVAPTTTSIAPTTSAPFGPGASGIGDSFYPGLGNGGYDVQHYDLDLTYEASGAVESDVVVTAVATQNLSGFNLDFVGWEITDLTVDGAEIDFRRDGGELVIGPAQISSGDHFTVEISYHGTPTPMHSLAIPLEIGWLTGLAGEQFVVAEPDAAHSWFPANDHPLDKATFSFAVTVPAGFMGAANGELMDVVESDTTTTYHWAMDAPMAPYLATVVIGEGWEIVPDPISTGVAGLPVRNVLPPDLVENAPAALAKTGEIITVLEEAFGPFPFDRYGIAVVDGFPAALENQTLSVFGRTMFDAPFFEYVHVHELAHQWFGDSVSVAQWSDIWLNEGFATLSELLWVEHLYGAGAYREEVANRIEAARIAEYGPPGTPSPDDLFSGSVYQRGALVLVALRDEIGDDAFFETLRTYAGRYADDNATTDDFIALAEEISGRDLTDLFATWLYGEELPK
ncbi:MAG: M1 family metallopeptidase [Actinomycetota bacterium]|nr:M1 family metallopeptidase [Actinomycetota bacterium]